MKESNYFKLRGYRVVTDSNEIWYRGNVIKLTPKEKEVLVLLYNNKGKTVSRTRILDEVWRDSLGNNSGLTQIVSKLRHIFKDNPKRPKLIKTIPKIGYKLVSNHDLLSETNSEDRNIVMGLLAMSDFSKYLILIILILIFISFFVHRIEIRVDQLPMN